MTSQAGLHECLLANVGAFSLPRRVLTVSTDIVSQDMAATLKVLYALFKKHKGK